MKTEYTIADHYDPDGIIDAGSDPVSEFNSWRDFSRMFPNIWRGDEFNLADFERYIENLKRGKI